ncbi:hypothetical protein ACRAR1_29585 [Streptomyces sanyensis]|uniref:hypothetical protein n=1 Tax=Streptomyces sanyensis TaxID=568869 RepID=UPI003D76FFFE
MTDVGWDDADQRKAVTREGVYIAQAIAGALHPLYVTPEETRDLGYILTEHFGAASSPAARSASTSPASPSDGCAT